MKTSKLNQGVMKNKAQQIQTPRQHNQVLQSRKLDLNKVLREHFTATANVKLKTA